MAEIVKKMKKTDESTSKKVNSFLTNYRGIVITLACVLVIGAVVLCLALTFGEKNTEKNLSKLDSIEYDLIRKVDDKVVTDAEVIHSRQTMALENLKEFKNKKGVVGTRAKMLEAEIYFMQEDYAAARDAWTLAANASKGAYTASRCNYNAAVSAELAGDKEKAVLLFEASAKAKDNYNAAHAYFSAGRVNESLECYNAALKDYKKVTDDYSTSSWAGLANDRIIYIKANGLVTE